MAISINDLDDDDVIVNPGNQEPDDYHQEPSDQGSDDLITDFLKTRGIDDPSKINFEEDDGQIVQRDWNSLSKEEKFNILNTPLEVETQQPQQVNNELSEDEISLLNQIRQSNMSPQDWVNALISQQQEPQYKVDDLDDDSLYLLDLESRVGELTDDEAAQALNFAKQNEDFYKKQVAGIRKEYKEREDFKAQQDQAQLEQENLERFQQYQNEVVSAIDNFSAIGNLDLNLTNEDKEELAAFMLSQDETGKNYLYQALQDPETLMRAAWFILNGEEAFNNVTDYFTNQIKTISESQYKKGFEDGQKGKPQLVINKNNKSLAQRKNLNITSIDELDDDE